MHLFILDGVEMDVANPINCLLLERKDFSQHVNGLFCDIFAKMELSTLGSSLTYLFKGNKAKPSVTPGLLVHQHHSILHIAFDFADQKIHIFTTL